jgi:integrase
VGGKSITLRAVNALRAGKGDALLWDSQLKGFAVRARPGGGHFYLVKYRAGGRQRWYTIGRHASPWTPETARREARRILGEVAAGRDPAKARADEQAAGTVAELCDAYMIASPTRVLKKSERPKKPSTLATDKGRIERHIKPLMGRLQVRAVTTEDVKRFLADVAAGKTAADLRTGPRGRAIVEGGEGTATRTVGLLGGIFSYAVEKGLRADNPVRGVPRYKDKRSERYLSAAELARLGQALAAAERSGENPMAVAAIRLLIFTGARKSEIALAKWDYIDAERGYLRLPDSKTGAKLIPLGAPALDVLANLPRIEGNPYILPGDKPGAPYSALPRAWERIRARARLPGVRIHDLRHSFASVGAAAGDSLIVIGALLGHRDAKTTLRYAHLGHDPIKSAANRIAGTIAAAMAGASGEVVPLAKRAHNSHR